MASQRWFANDQVATNGRYLELEELIHSEVGTGEEEVIVVRYCKQIFSGFDNFKQQTI